MTPIPSYQTEVRRWRRPAAKTNVNLRFNIIGFYGDKNTRGNTLITQRQLNAIQSLNNQLNHALNRSACFQI